MSLEQANTRARAAVDRFRDRAGFEGGIGYPRENASEQRDVYALDVHVDEAGRLASYLGAVYGGPEARARDDPEVVERLHERADRFHTRARESITSVTELRDEELDSVSPAILSPDWQMLGTMQRELVSDWGTLQSDVYVGSYVYNDDDEAKTHHFGTLTSHTNSPGVNEYSDNNYHQKSGSMRHGYGSGFPVDLGGYAPSSNETGNYSYGGSIGTGIGGPTLGVQLSYSPTDVSRFDESDEISDRAAWDWKYNPKLLWDGATGKPDTFEPSSVGYSYTAPEQGDLIVTVDRSADWFDPRSGSASPTVSSTTSLRYDTA